MKNSLHIIGAALLLLTLDQASFVFAQGTAFTYQGQLQNNGVPASGTYNFQFSLYTDATAGTAVAGPVTNSAVIVTNGLLTVIIDFGSGAWNGQTNWLQIGVETNGAVSFSSLSPRQLVMPVPYAIFAEQANEVTGLYASNSLDNFFAGPSAGNPGSDSGGQNTAYGFYALESNFTGFRNTAIGYGALDGDTSGSDNIAVGDLAGIFIIGSSNIDIGNKGNSPDTGIIRIGSSQTATYLAGTIYGNGSGLTNLNAGELSGILNLSTPEITSGGTTILYSPSGPANFFAGQFAGNEPGDGGQYNIAVGYAALAINTNGSANTAVGFFALRYNITGTGNTDYGYEAGFDNSGGDYNTGIGYQVLTANGTGNNNTAVGSYALQLLGFNSGGGSNNIALGNNAGSTFRGDESYNIDIGNTGVLGENNIIRIGTPGIQTATYLSGTVYANGVALTSDRNAKEHFSSIDSQAVLAKVAALPVTEWNYKDDKTAQHIGPMAQDFHAAFGLDGADDTHISVVDEGGVALAAIQGLEAENVQLKKRLNELEGEVKALEHNKLDDRR